MSVTPKFQGIRHITPAQAELLRARIRRDISYYNRLITRLTQWHFRDADTQKMIVAACRIEHWLTVLSWATQAAGAGLEYDPEPWCADWRGEGI